MQRAIELFREKKIPISLIMLDIDFFKKLNDTYGHSAGDEVLRQFSNILKKNIRVEDSVFRYGGEEFAIVAHGNTKEDIKVFTERILAEVQSTVVKYKKHKMQFTFSAGIEAMKEGLTRETLIQRADAALYWAKNSGRNQVICFEERMLKELK
jgi:diguanylate cyclase (GGDEF)-like protein